VGNVEQPPQGRTGITFFAYYRPQRASKTYSFGSCCVFPAILPNLADIVLRSKQGCLRNIIFEKGEIMKTRKHFILFVVLFVLVVGLLAVGWLKTTINNPPAVQASSKEVRPPDKTTDRRAFLEGVFFTQGVMENIREEGKLSGLRALSDRKEILRGLRGIQVVVEKINPEAEKYGLTEQLLQTDTELRLRQHGIRVGPGLQPEEEEALKRVQQAIRDKATQFWQQASNVKSDPDFLEWVRVGIRVSELSYPYLRPISEQLPILYVNVNTVVFEEIGRVSFSIEVRLEERAARYRDSTLCLAPIWEKSSVGACSTNDLKEYVREGLRDYLDEFINDYLAANPIDRSSQNEP
jgi:hypothetical protein